MKKVFASVLVSLLLALICSFCFMVTMGPWFASFFLLNYPEIEKNTKWLQTSATVEGIVENPSTCCFKRCEHGCTNGDLSWPDCGYDQPANAQVGESYDCLGGYECCYRSCSGTKKNKDCSCRNSVHNLWCAWECEQCWHPIVSFVFPLVDNPNTTIHVNHTVDCGTDVACKNEAFKTYAIGTKHPLWYNPHNPHNFAIDISFSWWKWTITGLLTVVPMTLLIVAMCSCCGVTVFSGLGSAFLVKYLVQNCIPERQPVKQQPLFRESEMESFNIEHVSYDKAGKEALENKKQQLHQKVDTLPAEDFEMVEEQLSLNASTWDSYTVNKWISVMEWKDFDPSYRNKYTGKDLLDRQRFNDSAECQQLKNHMFSNAQNQIISFDSGVRLMQLYNGWYDGKKAVPTAMWNVKDAEATLPELKLGTNGNWMALLELCWGTNVQQELKDRAWNHCKQFLDSDDQTMLRTYLNAVAEAKDATYAVMEKVCNDHYIESQNNRSTFVPVYNPYE